MPERKWAKLNGMGESNHLGGQGCCSLHLPPISPAFATEIMLGSYAQRERKTCGKSAGKAIQIHTEILFQIDFHPDFYSVKYSADNNVQPPLLVKRVPAKWCILFLKLVEHFWKIGTIPHPGITCALAKHDFLKRFLHFGRDRTSAKGAYAQRFYLNACLCLGGNVFNAGSFSSRTSARNFGCIECFAGSYTIVQIPRQ